MFLTVFSIVALNGSSPGAVDPVRMAFEGASAYWFNLVKYSGYAVAFGCALEVLETFIIIQRWWLLRFRGDERQESIEDKKKWGVVLAAIGLLIIVAGISLETYAEGKVSDVDALLRTYESDKITAAEWDAASAIREAGTAKSSAKDAAAASTIAQGASSNAFILASGARKEADSLTYEINAANRRETDTVSRLADAEKRLADSTQREAAAEAKLSAIKAPRSLVRTEDFVSALKPFKGTEFTVNAFQDEESNNFSRILASVLKEAGWVRKQPVNGTLGVPTMQTIFEVGEKKEYVPSCLETGVAMHITENESLEQLNSRPLSSLPIELQAGIMLHNALGSNISPPDENNVSKGLLDFDPRPETTIRICVGKKP